MNRRSKIIGIIIGIVVLLGGGIFAWAYFSGAIKPSADVTSYKRQVQVSDVNFVPGEVIVKLKPTEANKIKVKMDSEVDATNTGIKEINKINEDNEVEEVNLVPVITNGEEEVLKIKFDVSDEKLEKISLDQVSEDKQITEETDEITEAQLKTLQVIDEYNQLPEVEYAEPNYIYEMEMTPNDTFWGLSGSWGQDYEDLWGLRKINSQTAWDVSQGENVRVAVIDSGVDYYHTDIIDNILFTDDSSAHPVGYDFGDNDPDPMDDYGHGTHVAGIISAVGNNHRGIIGAAPKSKVMPIKVSNSNGVITTEYIAEGIDFAINNQADVIHMSLGSYGESELIKEMVDLAYNQNITVVAASGNDNTDAYMHFPSGYDNVISVGATDYNNQKAYYSNFGAIDVVAPGGDSQNILSLKSAILNDQLTKYIVDSPASNDINQYLRLSGTSMSSPFVSGLVAQIKSKNPNWSNSQIKDSLIYNTTDLGSSGFNSDFGYGLIDTYKTLTNENLPDLESEITSPYKNEIIQGKISITGTASGGSFGSYKLEYNLAGGDGSKWSSEWSEITSSDQPIENGQLAEWDTTNIGIYDKVIIKLTVADNDGKEKVFIQYVKIHNNIVSGWPITNDNLWSSSPIITDLNNDNNQEIIFQFSSDGWFDSSIVIYDHNGRVINGWPKNIGVTYRQDVNAIAVGNIDQTEEQELVFFEKNQSKININALHYDGSAVDGWPVILDDTYSLQNTSVLNISLADITGDGLLETIVTIDQQNKIQIYAINQNGSILDNWPQTIDNAGSFPSYMNHKVTSIADLDNDGKDDIIQVSNSGKIFAYNYKGENITGWPVNTDYDYIVATGDINNDNKIEVISASENKIKVRNLLGELISEWNFGPKIFGLVLADVNGDGKAEIIASTENTYGAQVGIYNERGESISNVWPKTLDPASCEFLASSDINNDGKSEIIIAYKNIINILDVNGNNLNGWPTYFSKIFRSTPAIADLNNNGQLEMIAINGGFYEDQSIYNINILDSISGGNIGWPMYQHDSQHTANYNFGLTVENNTNPQNSEISTDKTQVSIDNQEPAKITVKLKDGNGNPVSGKNVVLSSTGEADLIMQPSDEGGGLTNDAGETFGFVSSNSTGVSEISATDVTNSDNPITLDNKVQIEFVSQGKTINLKSGDNYVSFPYKYKTLELTGLTSSDRIYKNRQYCYWRWCRSSWQRLSNNNLSDQIIPGLSYKIVSGGDHQITVTGEEVTKTELDLTKGDNYISTPFKQKTNLQDVKVKYYNSEDRCFRRCLWSWCWNWCSKRSVAKEGSIIDAVNDGAISNSMKHYNSQNSQWETITINDESYFSPFETYRLNIKQAPVQLIFE